MADDTEAQRSADPDESYKFWMAEIKASRDREREWRKSGQDILDLYEAQASTPTPFNILYSNTETMMPALYSRLPRPVVERRFRDQSPLGSAAAKAGQRVLEYLLDTNMDGYDTYHRAFKQATLSAALPGRGWTSVKYDAQVEGEEGSEYTKGEQVCPEIQSWKRVYHGYARKWSKVPWVAYELYVDKDQAADLFGEELAAKLNYSSDEPEHDGKDRKDGQEQHKGEVKTTCIYKIWDKDGGRKIRFFSPHYKDGQLKEEEDPYGLTGFFDCPEPLQFVEKHDSLIPTALYTLYKSQAEELNVLTHRIKKLAKAIKARGAYAGDHSDTLQKLMEADDNELVPAETASSLAFEKGLQNAIWMLPIEQWIVVLRELMTTRESVKQVIYEITGISDILRGATKASETLGAQELKSQWGGLRLKNKQSEVARYCCDIMRMTLELAASKFSVDTWMKMTGLQYPTMQQKQQMQQMFQAMQQQAMQMQQMGQQPQPEQVKQFQQLQAQLQQPAWEEIIQVLKDDLQRSYRIDIETNSTVEPEAAEDRKDLMELFMALGQFVQGAAPLVQSGALSIEAVKGMILILIRPYRFGSEVEDYIKQMQQPKPPDEQGAEAVKKEKESAMKEVEMQKKQAEGDIKMKMMDATMQIKQKEMDLQMREAQLKVDQDVFAMNQQAQTAQLQSKAQVESTKLDFKSKQNQLENSKFKTENVANQKVDQGLQKAVQAMESMVKQLVQVVGQQSQQTQKMVDGLAKSLTAPRTRKAIRGKDGKIEGMEEMVA